jgi:hypothetical protein
MRKLWARPSGWLLLWLATIIVLWPQLIIPLRGHGTLSFASAYREVRIGMTWQEWQQASAIPLRLTFHSVQSRPAKPLSGAGQQITQVVIRAEIDSPDDRESTQLGLLLELQQT